MRSVNKYQGIRGLLNCASTGFPAAEAFVPHVLGLSTSAMDLLAVSTDHMEMNRSFSWHGTCRSYCLSTASRPVWVSVFKPEGLMRSYAIFYWLLNFAHKTQSRKFTLHRRKWTVNLNTQTWVTPAQYCSRTNWHQQSTQAHACAYILALSFSVKQQSLTERYFSHRITRCYRKNECVIQTGSELPEEEKGVNFVVANARNAV